MDLFTLWRLMLALVVTIYTTIVLAQFIGGWLTYLYSGDTYTNLLRRYLLLHGLRLRAKTFAPDLIVSALLCVVLALLTLLHLQVRHGHL